MTETHSTVMLVDDHAVVRTGYRMLLELTGEFSVIAEVETGDQALHEYEQFRPDVVVMDLNLPGTSGIEATRKIILGHPEAKILIFSIHDESIYVTRAFDAGASGYICKSCAPQEMVQAVRAIASGCVYVGTGLSNPASRRGKHQNDPLRFLSPREFEVFQLLGKGLGTRDIADTLNLSSKTVSNYSTLIKEKLGLSSSVELVKVAIQFLTVQGPKD